MPLNLTEITDGYRFEELVAAYFRELRASNHPISNVEVRPAGDGPDGGRDILINLKMNDSFAEFARRWIIQCKFHAAPIGKAQLATVNIPSLVHEHQAQGYLLICKTRATHSLVTMFENLNNNCRMGYKYTIWTGQEFLEKLRPRGRIIESFFPKFQKELDKRSRRKR